MPEQKLSIEEALNELREMFPEGAVIHFTTDRLVSVLGYDLTTANTKYQVLHRYGSNLNDVMAQVRAWKEQNEH